MFRHLLIGAISALALAASGARAEGVTSIDTETPAIVAEPKAAASEPLKPSKLPSVPSLSANSFVMVDFRSGRVLAASDADKQIEPASLTKMMTSYIVSSELAAGAISDDDKVKISNAAYKVGGSSMFLEKGTYVSVANLKRGMIIQSGNDATIALAEHMVGSEERFVEVMNDYARRLGMRNTQFKNATGMPAEGHYSTAIDLAILGAALIRDYPEDYKLYGQKEFTWADIEQPNRNNLLLRDKTVDGIKTGHTKSAGYCLVASAERENTRLVTVVAGTPSSRAREDDSLKLLRYGFANYETHQVLPGGEEIDKIRVLMGAESEVSGGLKSPLYVSVPNIANTSVNTSMVLDHDIVAPVAKGQVLATIVVTQDGQEISRKPLVALDAVAEGAWWQKLRDRLIQKISSLLQ